LEGRPLGERPEPGPVGGAGLDVIDPREPGVVVQVGDLVRIPAPQCQQFDHAQKEIVRQVRQPKSAMDQVV
jgi:hypothetical protein